MTLDWGYLAGTVLFAVILRPCSVAAQIRAKLFHRSSASGTIVASTTFGTTMADFADRSLGIGYTGERRWLLTCLLLVLALWYWSERHLRQLGGHSAAGASSWAAITFSQTLGTALGDWAADTGGLGYLGGAGLFAAGLLVLTALYLRAGVSRVALFWAALSSPAARRNGRGTASISLSPMAGSR